MCFTKDMQPLVGRIKEREGQYISSGYSGHGMVRSFSCGRHVAEKILKIPHTTPEIDEVFDPDRVYLSWSQFDFTDSLLIEECVFINKLFK